MDLEKMIEQLVEEKVNERLAKEKSVSYSNNSSCCIGWMQLRKEINDYSTSVRKKLGVSYSTVQQSFYGPIKLRLGIKHIQNMDDSNIETAREVFDQVKDWISEGIELKEKRRNC